MCGIAGLFSKSASIEEELGAHLSAMLSQLADRGPDSAGIALYRDRAPAGACKVSIFSPEAVPPWPELAGELAEEFGGAAGPEVRASHALFVVPGGHGRGRGLAHRAPSRGPGDERRRAHRDLQGGRRSARLRRALRPRGHLGDARPRPHPDGHREPGHDRALPPLLDRARPLPRPQRVALEPQPAAHRIEARGIRFQTDNDTEVAAGYLTWRLSEGDDLEQALRGCLHDLDGFYTFAVGTADGFAVLRDPIACKPAVLAESDDWVAMASEYRAIAALPGADEAELWEPEPGRVYSWQRAMVA